MLTLLYGCGLRLAEALSLTRREAPIAAGAIRITGKGNKQRLVPILPVVAAAIADTGFAGYMAHEFVPTRDPLTSLREAVALCDV